MNVLYGLLQPDEGEVHLRGEPVHIGSPREAIGLRIGMVHQHFMLIPVMTVAENVVLASEPRKGAMLDRDAAEQRVRELSERFGLAVDPRAYVEDIGVGQQQRVEILRVLHRGADILILDEPTAVLTAQEIEELFSVLRALTAEGVSVIFISHKLREVLEIADRVTVLRRGKKIDTVPTEGATEASLAKLMVGRDVLFRVEKDARAGGRRRCSRSTGLEVARRPRAARAARALAAGPRRRDRRRRRRRRQRPVRAGRGDHRAARPRRPATSASAGATSPARGVRGALAAGVGHIAEDRHRRGLVLDFSLAENLALREYRRAPLSRFGLLSPKRMDAAGAAAARAVRRPRRRARDAGRLALGRQPAEGRDRARARRGAAGHDRRAADARARRRRDRVRPPAAARAARRRPRRAARVARARGDPLARRPRARDLRGADRGRARRRTLSDEELGVAMLGGQVSRAERPGARAPGRSPSPRGCRATCAAAGSSSRSSPRCSRSSSAGSSSRRGRQPDRHLQGDLRRLRPELAVPVGDRRRPHARGAEPAADADPDHAADPHRPRGRVRVPRRPVQHRRPGPVPRRQHGRGLGRLVVRRHAGLLHIVLAIARRLRRRRRSGRASPAC